MHYKLELDERQIPVLGLLHNLMTESLNELGFSIAEDLTAYSLIRTFTIIKTIKSISEDIIGKDRTTIIKSIQRLTEIEDLLFNQLELFPGIIDGRISLTGIIDSTFLKRYSEKVYSAKLRWNYVKECYEILQEQINCCLFTDKGIYTAYTEIKPPEKKSTEIYAEIIDYLSKKRGEVRCEVL